MCVKWVSVLNQSTEHLAAWDMVSKGKCVKWVSVLNQSTEDVVAWDMVSKGICIWCIKLRDHKNEFCQLLYIHENFIPNSHTVHL